MSNIRDQIHDLIDRAGELEDGPAKIALVEEAVNLAEVHRDEDAAFKARYELVQAATFGGRPDLAIVAYAWVLAKVDADPQRFVADSLLWRYKWVVDKSAHYPTISRQQIDDLFADMTRRYQAEGSTLHAVYSNRRTVALMMGDRELAAQQNALLQKTERDHLSDCHACVQDEEVWHYCELGEDEEAIEAAKPIFRGKLSCSSIPECTHANVLMPLMRLGRVQEAAKHHKAGYRLIAWNPAYLPQQAQHMTFLALSGNLDRGVTLLNRHLPNAVVATSPRWQYQFYSAARLLLERLAQENKAAISLNLPEPLKPLGENGLTPVPGLTRWIDDQLQELGSAFDRRNGNDSYLRKVQAIPALLKYVQNLTVSGG
jgi:hypothetical protein